MPFIVHKIARVRNRLQRGFFSSPPRIISPFYDVGFHGDQYLLDLVETLMEESEVFIETGTNVGSTLAYVARVYPHVQCLSCEPGQKAFQHATINTALYANVSLYNETSQKFLRRLKRQYAHTFSQNVLFWLDAHGYGFAWPLKEEIAFITKYFPKAHILIDDFKVPGYECFGYDRYQEQECSFKYIQDALNSIRDYTIYYPAYTERTSHHHPLLGWGMIEYGHETTLTLPDFLQANIRQVDPLMHKEESEY